MLPKPEAVLMGDKTMSDRDLRTTCVIAGGGPAGLMLGYLLARAGVPVTVMEKHSDFLRDFRGDSVHPSTLEVMHELGLLDQLLARPHQKVAQIGLHVGNTHLHVADFSHLPVHCPNIAFMPQWDFLNMLAAAGEACPSFDLRMNTEVEDLVIEQGRVVGVRARDPEGMLTMRAALVVGADGRGSQVRARSGLVVHDLGAPIDVLWLRLSRREGDPAETLGRVNLGQVLIMIDRGDYWQCAFIIEKGAFDKWKERGLPAFQSALATLQPALADRVGELHSWDDVKLLSVRVDRLEQWAREGLLCIGDAAHAMSPAGGVGINLAIQDAVATANLLTEPLRKGRVTLSDLETVQKRRAWPARVTQAFQVFAHRRFLLPVLRGAATQMSPPLPLRLLDRFPLLRRLPGRAVGMGVRPEHVTVDFDH
jgi:2-polyprenyl-6-methoxyphenol hydroxylase-like FAD-dependent oxidoreductase